MQKSVNPPVPQGDTENPVAFGKEASQQHSLPQLFAQYQTSERGLTSEEARKRLGESGPNEPTAVHRWSTLQQLLVFIANPLVLILLVASIITAVLGEILNASIIIAMVFLSVALNFFQTFRSQRAVERLRAGVAPTATVLRDGTWTELPRNTLVTPLAAPLGFMPLPALYFLFLAGMIATYLLLVEVVKRWLMRRLN